MFARGSLEAFTPVSTQQIDDIFNDYVFGFMAGDIEREIWLATQADADKASGRKYPGAGNVLAALGLTCYSEFLGSFITGTRNAPKDNWEAFVKKMGSCYQKLIATHGGRLWDAFRNGLAHEYAVKKDCTIVMLKNGGDCGIGIDDKGRYYFVVETYYQDFIAAARTLHKELQTAPVIPK